MALDINEVARVYVEACLTSQRPVKVVSEMLGITPQYASNRVKHARKLGLIPPSDGTGRAGMNPRIRAIAEDVGCDPYALRAAIIRHSTNGSIGFGYVTRQQVGRGDD